MVLWAISLEQFDGITLTETLTSYTLCTSVVRMYCNGNAVPVNADMAVHLSSRICFPAKTVSLRDFPLMASQLLLKSRMAPECFAEPCSGMVLI